MKHDKKIQLKKMNLLQFADDSFRKKWTYKMAYNDI